MSSPSTVGARRLVSLQDAAEYLGVDVLTVRRRIAAGDLQAFRIGSGTKPPIRVDLAQIDNELLRPIPTVGTGR